MLSGGGLCNEPIPRLEQSYRLCVIVCDLETSRIRRPWPVFKDNERFRNKVLLSTFVRQLKTTKLTRSTSQATAHWRRLDENANCVDRIVRNVLRAHRFSVALASTANCVHMTTHRVLPYMALVKALN